MNLRQLEVEMQAKLVGDDCAESKDEKCGRWDVGNIQALSYSQGAAHCVLFTFENSEYMIAQVPRLSGVHSFSI